jgi:hypothetical protein
MSKSRIMAIAESVKQSTKSIVPGAFLSDVKTMTRDQMTSVVNQIANDTFKPERARLSESANLGTNAGVVAKSKLSLNSEMKKEYVARAENLLMHTIQSTGAQSTAVSPVNQAGAVSLVGGIIDEAYNKFMTTEATRAPEYLRTYTIPLVIDHMGNVYDLIALQADSETLEKVAGASTISVLQKVKFGGKVNVVGNLVDLTNQALALASPSALPINSPRNFVSRGIKITEVTYDGKAYPQEWESLGVQSQNGQNNTDVAIISLSLNDISANGGSKVTLLGKVTQDGTIELLTNDVKLTDVTVKYYLPPIDQQAPFTVSRKSTKYVKVINETARAQTTLNTTITEDHKYFTGEDLVERFNTDVMITVNAQKDNYAIKTIRTAIAELKAAEEAKKAAGANYVNTETMVTARSSYAERTVDTNTQSNGNQNIYAGYNVSLANALYNVASDMNVKLNPTEARFAIATSIHAFQRINTAGNETQTRFNLVGDMAEDGIAGFKVNHAYQLNRAIVGGYDTVVVASNRLKNTTDKTKKVTLTDLNGNPKVDPLAPTKVLTGIANVYEYLVLTKFEQSQDSFVFVNGLEVFEEGTGMSSAEQSKSVNYSGRYTIATLNKVAGLVTLIERPEETL